MEDKNDPHELQWLKLESENSMLSTSKNDIYDRRASSCTNLLNRFC